MKPMSPAQQELVDRIATVERVVSAIENYVSAHLDLSKGDASAEVYNSARNRLHDAINEILN
jgi:hypothetical protein